MKVREINFTERQLRFIKAIIATGRAGTDQSDVVRRALDARIQQLIDDGAISERDGGEPEQLGPPPKEPASAKDS